MNYVGFNSGSGVNEWYNAGNLVRIAKGSNSIIIFEFTNITVKISIGVNMADQTIDDFVKYDWQDGPYAIKCYSAE